MQSSAPLPSISDSDQSDPGLEIDPGMETGDSSPDVPAQDQHTVLARAWVQCSETPGGVQEICQKLEELTEAVINFRIEINNKLRGRELTAARKGNKEVLDPKFAELRTQLQYSYMTPRAMERAMEKAMEKKRKADESQQADELQESQHQSKSASQPKKKPPPAHLSEAQRDEMLQQYQKLFNEKQKLYFQNHDLAAKNAQLTKDNEKLQRQLAKELSKEPLLALTDGGSSNQNRVRNTHATRKRIKDMRAADQDGETERALKDLKRRKENLQTEMKQTLDLEAVLEERLDHIKRIDSALK